MTYLIVLSAVLARFVPHPPNFSPVYAALLFGGARLKARDFIWYPVALLLASDLVLTTQVYHMRFGWKGELIDLLAFAAMALIGRSIRQKRTVRNIVAGSLAGATAFFLISNFGVWLASQMYPPSWAGMLACYVAALPFFPNTAISSLLYSGVLFGLYGLYAKKFAQAG